MRQVGDLLAGDSPWLRRASHVLKWLAVLAACYLGGVAATNLAPTVAETSQYRAVLRLDPVPRHSPVLHAPTIVGDVDVQFASPLVAPGLDVQVAVREEITNLFTRPNVDIRALQPSPDEISSAIAQAAIGVGIRFVLGATAIAVLLALASHYIRQRTTRRRHVLFVASAMVVATAVTFGGIALTYQPSRFAEYRTSGVLGVVQRNAGLLADVEARATQVTPYFRNLLAVTQALQQKYVAGNVNEPVSARLLLVSDIHGANQYALMRTIIEEEDIDAVIDSGDLVNFGRVQEGDAAGLYRSIQSLGVPYIFTSGNHDQSSAERPGRRRPASARIPNVVLLEDAARVAARADLPRPAHHRLQRPALLRRRQRRPDGQGQARGRPLQRGRRRPAGARHRRDPRAVCRRAGRAGTPARQRAHAHPGDRGQPDPGRHLHRWGVVSHYSEGPGAGARRPALLLRHRPVRHVVRADLADALLVPQPARGTPGLRQRPGHQRRPHRPLPAVAPTAAAAGSGPARPGQAHLQPHRRDDGALRCRRRPGRPGVASTTAPAVPTAPAVTP